MSTSTLSALTTIEVEKKSKNRSLIILQPLQKGFGHTLGYSLRRVLVSSLTGCAVIEVHIEGVLHEYDTLEGVQEDVLAILLNLRESAFALTGSRDKVTLTLKRNQIGPVRLGDIDLPHDVEVANPEHIIAHLTQAVDLNIALKVMRGQGEYMVGDKGFMNGEADETTAIEVNTLHLNAIFNPIKRVSYEVERARVEERTDLDKLIIDLETNGTCTPEAALQEAAFIFKKQGLDVILNLKQSEAAAPVVENDAIDPIFRQPIETLGLGPRSAKCLRAENIFFIGDLVTKRKTDLLLTPNLGKRSLEDIESALKKVSLELGTVLPEWPPENLVYPNEEENEGVIE